MSVLLGLCCAVDVMRLLQLFPLTFVGLPPELLRVQGESEGVQQRVVQEVPVRKGCAQMDCSGTGVFCHKVET